MGKGKVVAPGRKIHLFGAWEIDIGGRARLQIGEGLADLGDGRLDIDVADNGDGYRSGPKAFTVDFGQIRPLNVTDMIEYVRIVARVIGRQHRGHLIGQHHGRRGLGRLHIFRHGILKTRETLSPQAWIDSKGHEQLKLGRKIGRRGVARQRGVAVLHGIAGADHLVRQGGCDLAGIEFS